MAAEQCYRPRMFGLLWQQKRDQSQPNFAAMTPTECATSHNISLYPDEQQDIKVTPPPRQ